MWIFRGWGKSKNTKKNWENGSLIMCGEGRGGREGACADGVFPVSVVVIMCLWQGDRVACIYKGFDYFSFKGAGRGRGEGGVWIPVRGRSDEWREEQMNWMAEEQFGIFEKNKKRKTNKLGITTPPCGRMMQVVNEDETCYFNVIFYVEIILLIKSLSTVVPPPRVSDPWPLRDPLQGFE